MTEILVLYYSAHGSVHGMAQLVARGINQVAGASAREVLQSIDMAAGDALGPALRDPARSWWRSAQRPVIRSVRRQRVGRALRRARRRGAGGVAHVLSRREVCGGKVEVIAREGHRKQQ